MRTVVPDADLRTYEPPEPVGFTTGGDRWTDPGKHKSRWSIYSLKYVLEEIRFNTNALVFCDKYGKYHYIIPIEEHDFYANCVDKQFILDFSYVYIG